ncbi:unnamed protein product [Wickerhamomyces anomalus]
MSSVAISYELRTIKLKATPELSTSLPFRLLNLPSGAKLTLKATKTKKASEINIKVQFINSPFEKNAVVKKVGSQLTLEQLVQEIEKDILSPILSTSKNLKFQGLTKVVTQEDFGNVTLAQFGAENNASIRLIFEVSNKVTKPEIKPTDEAAFTHEKAKEPEKERNVSSTILEEKPMQDVPDIEAQDITAQDKQDTPVALEPDDDDDDDDDDVNAMEVDEPQQQSQNKGAATGEIQKHLYVYKAPEKPIETYEPQEEDYDLTVSHARQYQSILSQRAHESYKSKRLRQEANKKKITNIEIRIRFPDESSLQVNFTPLETNKDLYNLVASTLVDTSSFDEYLDKAKDLKEAEDVKLDLERQLMKDDNDEDNINGSKIQNGQLPKKTESSSFKSKTPASEQKEGSKVPKWLKLGKK